MKGRGRPTKEKLRYKDAPLTSIEQYKKNRTETNALNKERAKRMERKIASTLRGRRVPMSGAAAQYKGDVEIPFYNYPGKYIIECKLSSQLKANGDNKLRFDFAWLPKLHNEVQSMNAKFGVLIIYFHGDRKYFVFMRKIDVERMINRYDSVFNHVLALLLIQAPLIDVTRNKSGKILKAASITKHDIEKHLTRIEGLEGMRFTAIDGEYLVMPLDTFKTVVAHL